MENKERKFKINELVAYRFDGKAYMILADKDAPYKHLVPTNAGNIVTEVSPQKNADYVLRPMGLPVDQFRPFVHATEASLLHLVDTDLKTCLSSGEFQEEGVNIEYVEFSFPDLSGRKRKILIFSDGKQSSLLYNPTVESIQDLAVKEAKRLGWITTPK